MVCDVKDIGRTKPTENFAFKGIRFLGRRQNKQDKFFSLWNVLL